MAAGTSIIREFLVRLRYAVDRDSLRNFQVGLANSAKEVAKIAVGMTASLTGIVAAVQLTAGRFADLYYQAQRAGTTATNLEKFGYAARQVGMSTQQFADLAVQLGTLFRENPYLRAYAATLGATARDTSVQIFQLAKAYRQAMEAGQAAEMLFRKRLETLGIDPEQIRQIAVNLREFESAARDLPRWAQEIGLNFNEAAEQGLDYIRQTNKFWFQLGIIWDRLVLSLMPAFQAGLRELSAYLKNAMPDIDKFVTGTIMPAISKLADRATWAQIEQEVKNITGAFNALAAILNTIGAAIEGIKEGITIIHEAWNLGTARDAVQPTPETERRIKERQNPVATGWDAFKRWLSGATHSPKVEIEEAKGLWGRFKDWLMGYPSAVPPRVAIVGDTPWQGYQAPNLIPGGAFVPGGAGGGTVGGVPGGAPRNNPGNIRNPLGGFMQYGSAAEGAAAMDKLLLRYQDVYGLKTLAGIISRWAPPNENPTGQLILNAARRTGIAPDQPLDLHDPATLAMLHYAIVAQEQGPRRAASWRDAARALRGRHTNLVAGGALSTPLPAGIAPLSAAGGTNVTLSPTTTIHVYGGGPEVGSYVFGAQSRLNGDLVRNLTTAIQ